MPRIALFVFVAAILSFAGCATDRNQSSYASSQLSTSEQQAATKYRRDISTLKAKLAAEKQQAEIDRLNKEIADLESRLAELEKKQAQEQSSPKSTSGGSGGSTSDTYVGPKGGCYRISKSGKKYYVKCQ